MLKVLRRIVQEMYSAPSLAESLQILVTRVREATETQACTIFLIDNERDEYVLMATDGLNSDMVQRVRVSLSKGLVGQVIQREELINLEDAPADRHFLYVPGIGEEPFKAFLGVPIIHHRQVLGVLVVQQEEREKFDETEEAFLVTLSTQLADVIAHSEASGIIQNINIERKNLDIAQDTCFTGIPSSPGIALGTAVIIYPLADLNAVPDREIEDIETEINQFQQALTIARDEIAELKQRLASTLPEEEQALFDVYLRILENVGIGSEVIEEIQAGNWAQGALRTVIKRHERQFEAMDDDYLRERATDIRDLGRRILSHLQTRQPIINHYFPQTILIGEEVTAPALADVPEGKLAGIISLRGSNNSHVAILARALGVPTIMGVNDMPIQQLEGLELIIDGYYGQIYVSPSQELRNEFEVLRTEQRQLDEELACLRDLPAKTLDGVTISLYVNTGLAADADLSLSVGAEGVGLYRTEVPFMVRDRFPAEEEQRIIYRQLLTAFSPRPVVMRTLDIGGDKSLPYFPVTETNPFLGWRGIRITLDHPEIFLVQARAMLKASVGLTNLHIMLPMITSVSELDEALRLLRQAYQEIREEGYEIISPRLGVMIEVPSAVYQAQQMAKRVDFISVGSNDLTQYLLAVDRNNARVANLYDSLHPAVLQALVLVVEACHKEGKKVSICGEMAGDPAAVILLLAMGFDALSMNATSLPRIKWVIRRFTCSDAKSLLQEVLLLDHPTIIRCHLELALEQAGLGSLVRAGKNNG